MLYSAESIIGKEINKLSGTNANIEESCRTNANIEENLSDKCQHIKFGQMPTYGVGQMQALRLLLYTIFSTNKYMVYSIYFLICYTRIKKMAIYKGCEHFEC